MAVEQKSSQYVPTNIPSCPFTSRDTSYNFTSYRRGQLLLNEDNKCIVMAPLTAICTEDIYIYHCASNSWKQIYYDPKLSLNDPKNIIMFGRKYLIHVNIRDNRWNTIPKKLKINKNGCYFIINNKLNFFSTDHKRYIWNSEINKFKFTSYLADYLEKIPCGYPGNSEHIATPGINGPIYIKSKQCLYSFGFDQRRKPWSPIPSSLSFNGCSFENKLNKIYSYSLLTNKNTELDIEITFNFEVLKIVTTINGDYILFFGSSFQTTFKNGRPSKKKSILIFNVNTNKFRMSTMDCTWFENYYQSGFHLFNMSVMRDFYDPCLLINGFIHFILNIFTSPNDITHLIQSMFIGPEFLTIYHQNKPQWDVRISLTDILY